MKMSGFYMACRIALCDASGDRMSVLYLITYHVYPRAGMRTVSRML